MEEDEDGLFATVSRALECVEGWCAHWSPECLRAVLGDDATPSTSGGNRRRTTTTRARPRRRVARRGSSRGSRDPRRGTIRARETRAMRRRVDDGRGALRRVAGAPARRPHRVHASRGRRAGGARGPAMAPRGRGRRRIRRRRRGRRERPQEDGRRASAHRARGRAGGRLVDAPAASPRRIGGKHGRKTPATCDRSPPRSVERARRRPGAFPSAMAIVANAVGGTGDLRALQLYHAPYGNRTLDLADDADDVALAMVPGDPPERHEARRRNLTYRAGPTHEFSVKRLWPPVRGHGGGRYAANPSTRSRVRRGRRTFASAPAESAWRRGAATGFTTTTRRS